MSRLGRALTFCALALLACITCAAPAAAQWFPWSGWGGGGGGLFGGGGGGGGYGGGGYRGEPRGGDDNYGVRERETIIHQRMQRRPVYVRPKPQQVRRVVPHPAPASPGGPIVADKPAPTPDKPAVAASFFVPVLGDSLGLLLAQGLQEAYEDRPEIAVIRKAKGDTGLITDDFYDWPKAVRELLASNEKISMAIMMVGSNDRQPVRDANGRYEPLSDKWKEIYGNRVEEIANAFKEKKIPLVWVGLPLSKSDRLSSDYSEFNEIFREHATKYDATYVDIWEAFGDARGLYNAFGPDVNGLTVKLRAMDGVHFTKPGARKLAHFVEGEVKRQFDILKPKTEPGVATLEGLPAPLAPAEAPGLPSAAPAGQAGPAAPPAPAPAQGPAQAAAPGGQQAALPQQAQPLAPPPPPPKPVSGPILPLTTPPIAPGGDLARPTRTRESSSDAQAQLDRAIARGQALEPKRNRADDFSWPRAEQQ